MDKKRDNMSGIQLINRTNLPSPKRRKNWARNDTRIYQFSAKKPLQENTSTLPKKKFLLHKHSSQKTGLRSHLHR